MDKWSKKKASETCGGIGMSRYIDSAETKRLSRLKNVKSTIGSKVSHNGWLMRQIEKRRVERLQQRKEEATRRPLGEGIQVDTRKSKSDAVSKCGLKLKINTNLHHRDARDQNNSMKDKTGRPIKPQEDGKSDNNLLSHPAMKHDKSDNSFPTLLRTNDHMRLSSKPKKKISNISVAHQTGTMGKENDQIRHNVTKKEQKPMNRRKYTYNAIDGTLSASNNKKYFRDINSLRRERADAIRMLEELDAKEEDRRSSISNNNHGLVISTTMEEDNDSCSRSVLQRNNHYSETETISYSSDDSSDSKYEEQTFSKPKLKSSSYPLYDLKSDDKLKSGINNSTASRSASEIDFESRQMINLADQIMVKEEQQEQTALMDDSFLNNLTHLSISFRDEFDTENTDSDSEQNDAGEEEYGEHDDDYVLSPI